MQWASPYYLLLLLLIPLALYAFIRYQKRESGALSKFAETRFHAFYLQQVSRLHWSVKAGLLLFSMFFVILALARPQWDRELQQVERSGLDIVVCIDVSKSMDAQDIQPSRLERAKDQISLFIDQLKGDRVALVAFAGTAFVQCPLTDDYGAAKLFLGNLDSNTIPVLGTDMASALRKAGESFPQSAKNKVVILISDGEDLEANAIAQAKKLADQKITVYALGVGSTEGSAIPMRDENGNTVYARNSAGDVIVTKLDVKTMQTIASATNGRFFLVTPQQSEIFAIMKMIEGLERNKYSSRFFNRYKEQYGWFAMLALLLLVVDGLIPLRKRTEAKRFVS